MEYGEKSIAAEELLGIIEVRFAAMVLYARSWNLHSAEDVVQDAFLKLLETIYKKGKPENPIAWLYRTIRNEAVSSHRKREVRVRHETELARNRPDWLHSKVENSVFSHEATEKLRELPLEQREIVVLRIWNRLSFDEISELTGRPKTTVYRIYTESLEELRKKLS